MAKNTSVALGDHFELFISEKIESGAYKNASEIIREGLRRLETDDKKLEVLRAKLAKGEQDAKKGRVITYQSASELNEKITEKLKARST